MSLKPITIDDFSGGITDFVKGSDLNQYVLADNLLIDRSFNIFSRPGSRLFNEDFPRPISIDPFTSDPTEVTDRISSLWNFDEGTALFVQNARKLFRNDDVFGWLDLYGPDGNPFFSSGDINSRVSGSMWKGHLFLTNDDLASPMKVYRDETGAYKSVTAGLPKYLAQPMYTDLNVNEAMRDLGNDIKAQMLLHYADVAQHPTAEDLISPAFLVAPDLVEGDSLETAITFTTQLMEAYRSHYQDAVKDTNFRAYHSNLLGDFPGVPNIYLLDVNSPTTFHRIVFILNELKTKQNWHVRSFKGHPTDGPAAPNQVTALFMVDPYSGAVLSEGPRFFDTEEALLDIWTIAINLKFQFNNHISDTTNTHKVAESFGGITDTNAVTASSVDITNDNLIELVAHIYAAYRLHQQDAAYPVYRITGTTTHGAPTLITTLVFSATAFDGQPNDLANGMYINYKDLPLGDNIFPPGTTIASGGGTTTLTMSAAHNAAGPDPATFDKWFSQMKYHSAIANGAPAIPENNALANLSTTITMQQIATDSNLLWLMVSDIRTKYNYHDNSFKYHGAATNTAVAQHQVNTTQTFTFYSFIYAFCYAYEYKTFSGETFLDRSTPFFKTNKTIKFIEQGPVSISFLNFVSNTVFNPIIGGIDTSGNYDTINIKVEIYRTLKNGNVLRKVGEVQNGISEFVDAMSDEELLGKEKLYTEGGVLGNDPPPRAKFLHILPNGLAYYGNNTRILDDGTVETITNRIEQAVSDDPDSVPSGNFIDLPLDVLSISSARNIPIAWTKEGTFRLEGFFNELGQGSIQAITVSDRIGLAASFSPVQVDGGVVFCGPDQFYLTDGYSLVPLGKAWPTTYANLVSTPNRANNILGTFDKLTNRITWGTTTNGVENDKFFTLDMNFPISPKNGGCFTTASNEDSFAPTAVCMFNGQLIRGDSRGYIFKHDPVYTSDPRIDDTIMGSLWAKKTVIYRYKSGALNFNSDAIRKWASLFEAKFENLGNLSVQIKSDNDQGRVLSNLIPIRSRNIGYQIDEKRYFPSGNLFFSDKQIEITNAFVIITNSDTLGLANTDLATLTVTINAGVFPTDMVDHTIAFDNDGYVQEFSISDQDITNTILTVLDPGLLFPVATLARKWVIRGYPKTEKMLLTEYSVWAMGMGVNQSSAVGESGENS